MALVALWSDLTGASQYIMADNEKQKSEMLPRIVVQCSTKSTYTSKHKNKQTKIFPNFEIHSTL